MMSMDILTATAGFLSFAAFLLVHVITFRRISSERLLQSLVSCMISIIWLPSFIIIAGYAVNKTGVSVQVLMGSAVVATFLFGLLCFVYVLCIFGPYETSVRMRLIREIAKGASKGVLIEELLNRYNAQTIATIRLKRLTGSGDILVKDGFYHLGRRGNFFFIFNAIAGRIKKCIAK